MATINSTLDGVPFRLEPTEVQWSFEIKAKEDHTVGGKVVQVFATGYGNLVVAGSFGAGGWREQQQFLDRMIEVAKRSPDAETEASRLIIPSKGWDFKVALRAYSGLQGGDAVKLSNEDFAPGWRLTFQIVNDNINLKTLAEHSYIERLARGIGWEQTEFNGPMDWTELQQKIDEFGLNGVDEYIYWAYGEALRFPQLFGGSPVGGPDRSSSTLSSSDFPPNVQGAWDFFKSKGLSDEQTAGVLGNIQVETAGTFDPGINEFVPTGDARGGYGLVQWTAGRRVALEQAAEAQGVPANDFNFQLNYIWFELETEPANGLDKLLATTTVRDATYAFSVYYERPADPWHSSRGEAAAAIYAEYSG